MPYDANEADDLRRRLPLGIPLLLGLLVGVVFLPWMLLTGKSERDTRRAIEAYEPFSLPPFPFRFSRTMKYDSLGFMGQGRQAGFWEWTPERMNLAEKGQAYFAESADDISSIVGAGRREVTGLQGVTDQGARRTLLFRYRWVEVKPPVTILLSKPPVVGRVYEGRAVLVKEGGAWRVERIETPDFDRPMALLLDTTAGIRR